MECCEIIIITGAKCCFEANANSPKGSVVDRSESAIRDLSVLIYISVF
jgi:hypothetical protein